MRQFKRLFFCVLYYGFIRRLPASTAPGGRLWKALRYAVCRNLFGSCGRNVNVESGASFHSGRNISIGDNSGIGKNAVIEGRVMIGSDVMMGPGVSIWTRNHAFERLDVPMREQGFREEKPVEICDDVWIGSNVIILPGIKIGKGAVIGAGAVVSRSIPEYAVATGNPCRVVKYRNRKDSFHDDAQGKKISAAAEAESLAGGRKRTLYSIFYEQRGRAVPDFDVHEQKKIEEKP